MTPNVTRVVGWVTFGPHSDLNVTRPGVWSDALPSSVLQLKEETLVVSLGRGGARRRRGRGPRGSGCLGLVDRRLLVALLGPRLVELDAPLALVVLHEGEAGAERAAAAALEAGDRLRRAAGGDELLGDSRRHLLAGLGLPDDEAAARVVARPAGVALAVLHDVVAADGARPEVGARDADVLELGVELADGGAGELGDVGHERLALLLAGL